MVVEPELTTAEAAEIAGVSDRTIRNWIKDELLPAKNTPSGRLVRKDDVLRVLREKGYTPPPQPPVELFPGKPEEAEEAEETPPPAEPHTPHGGDHVSAILLPYVEQLNRERERSDQLRAENRDLAARVGYLQGKLEVTEQKLLAATTLTVETAPSPDATEMSPPWWKRLFGAT